MNVPFQVDLKGQVALVTGGGGVLCSTMSRALAVCGAKIAVADLKQEAAEAVAGQIRKEGGTAIGVACNVLEKESLAAANDKVKRELGPIDILINGAGGNHPKGTTSLEHLRKEDLAGTAKEIITFYDLDP
ncbi:MAG TPA: SDR family NAD(P)-dependent oxidoreductase, partial [Candidatus Acidoferrum sp.]|nr:SDR family NAD(P)-dependent oxidoreductase [Candidatus Acidoferrum sp.]